MNVGLADVLFFLVLRTLYGKSGVLLGGHYSVVSLTFSSILHCIYVTGVYVPLGTKSERVSVQPFLLAHADFGLLDDFISLFSFCHLFVCMLPCSLNSMPTRLQTQALLPILCFSLCWSLFDNIPDDCSV